MKNTPTAGCLFSGMGGFASGMVAAGYDVRWANEINRHACAIFRHRLPDVRLLELCISTIVPEDLEPVDVITGGFPCQPFSSIGKRLGFGDGRTDFFFDALQIVKVLQPKVLLLENVPAVLRWSDVIIDAIQEVGYHCDTASFWQANINELTGIPQLRKRVIIMAFSKAHFSGRPFLLSPQICLPVRPLTDFIDTSRKADDIHYLKTTHRWYEMLEDTMEIGGDLYQAYQTHLSLIHI